MQKMRFNAILAALSAFSLPSDAISIPRPAGPYGISVATLPLTNYALLDPFAPQEEFRSTVISFFYPAASVRGCNWKLIPAYPKKTAAIFDAEVAFAGVPKGSLERLNMEICVPKACDAAAKDRLGEVPLVFFQSGLGLSRLWYSALAQSVASFGFGVVTVDIPYDADVVEFPDGHIITAINSSWNQAQSEHDVRVRAQDVSFVLDQLAKSNVTEKLLSGQPCLLGGSTLATAKAGIFGHSIGGAAAASTMFTDDRFIGGVNLDGGMYGPVIKEGLQNPLMLFGHESNGTSQTWIDIWPHLNWKLDIEILNSTHTTFTDIPLLAELIFGTPLPPFVQGIVGHIPGERARDVVTAYVAAFMNEILKCEPSALLQRPSEDFSEVVFKPSPRIA